MYNERYVDISQASPKKSFEFLEYINQKLLMKRPLLIPLILRVLMSSKDSEEVFPTGKSYFGYFNLEFFLLTNLHN